MEKAAGIDSIAGYQAVWYSPPNVTMRDPRVHGKEGGLERSMRQCARCCAVNLLKSNHCPGGEHSFICGMMFMDFYTVKN